MGSDHSLRASCDRRLVGSLYGEWVYLPGVRKCVVGCYMGNNRTSPRLLQFSIRCEVDARWTDDKETDTLKQPVKKRLTEK